jgi:hypothetical protein
VSAPGLPWKERAAFRAFLTDVTVYIKDLVAVAEDQTDPPGERLYGRAGARDLVDEAAGSLASMLAYARRGLAADEARIRVTVTPEIIDGRRRVTLQEASLASAVAYVLPGDLDGSLLRVIVTSDPDEENVSVLLPDVRPGGMPATVRREALRPVDPEEEPAP